MVCQDVCCCYYHMRWTKETALNQKEASQSTLLKRWGQGKKKMRKKNRKLKDIQSLSLSFHLFPPSTHMYSYSSISQKKGIDCCVGDTAGNRRSVPSVVCRQAIIPWFLWVGQSSRKQDSCSARSKWGMSRSKASLEAAIRLSTTNTHAKIDGEMRSVLRQGFAHMVVCAYISSLHSRHWLL